MDVLIEHIICTYSPHTMWSTVNFTLGLSLWLAKNGFGCLSGKPRKTGHINKSPVPRMAQWLML